MEKGTNAVFDVLMCELCPVGQKMFTLRACIPSELSTGGAI